MRRSVEIELNPVYMAEARRRYGDLDARISEIIGWVLFRVAIAQGRAELRMVFDELAGDEREFRALVGCEVLGLGSARPDIRDWLCEYVMAHGPGVGARYQVACAYSRLGSEARRSNRPQDAARLTRKGLEAVADLPPQAVTAILYHNLGVALEVAGDVGGAIEAFEDAADIDGSMGREEEAARSRQFVETLRQRIE